MVNYFINHVTYKLDVIQFQEIEDNLTFMTQISNHFIECLYVFGDVILVL